MASELVNPVEVVDAEVIGGPPERLSGTQRDLAHQFGVVESQACPDHVRVRQVGESRC